MSCRIGKQTLTLRYVLDRTLDLNFIHWFFHKIRRSPTTNPVEVKLFDTKICFEGDIIHVYMCELSKREVVDKCIKQLQIPLNFRINDFCFYMDSRKIIANKTGIIGFVGPYMDSRKTMANKTEITSFAGPYNTSTTTFSRDVYVYNRQNGIKSVL